MREKGGEKMKKACLEALAKLCRSGIKVANNSASFCWTFQPKSPKNLKKFKSTK